jgi:hypothetical protein
MTHFLLLFILASHKQTHPDYAKILNSQQQIIQTLQKENAELKYILYGPPGTKVRPRFENEKPVCPVPGFVLQYKVTADKSGIGDFSPYCIRIEETK